MKRTLLLFLLGLAGIARAQSTPPPPLSGEWRKQQLTNEFWAEGACVADVNHDGHPDVLSGPYWYEGPAFKNRHPIYPATHSFTVTPAQGLVVTLPGFEGGLGTKNTYSDNFISCAYDCNGDGWADYLVIGFPGKETVWYENPQGREVPWPRHVILDVTDNESPMFIDLTGDGKPELLCMSGGFLGYAAADGAHPADKWTWHPITPKGKYAKFTHGLGYGDLNGDGRQDILEAGGWWEQPKSLEGDPVWEFHPAPFGPGGAQMYGYDVNGDGKTDVITSLAAHGYGLAWYEQMTDAQGATTWQQHLITGTPEKPGETGVVFSQLHAIVLADLNSTGVPGILTGKRFRAHGMEGDPEPAAPAVVWWFELKREGGKVSWLPHLIDDNSGVGTQVMAADVTGDGKPSVVVGNKMGVFVHTRPAK